MEGSPSGEVRLRRNGPHNRAFIALGHVAAVARKTPHIS